MAVFGCKPKLKPCTPSNTARVPPRGAAAADRSFRAGTVVSMGINLLLVGAWAAYVWCVAHLPTSCDCGCAEIQELTFCVLVDFLLVITWVAGRRPYLYRENVIDFE